MSDDSSVAEVSLSPVLDLQAADPLRAELLALRGRPLRVDASQVSRLGGLCLQVLLSARTTWAEDGLPLRVEQASEGFLEQLAAFGGPQIDYEPEGANL
ncbi:STAS domain-containing protein [Phenylobacterium sp.]|uniref:STAS domain-containing protein n=1 Tax=Phenylobacterium sp. TaxID=1871053 RepID=UPI0008C53B30|nr:STAS domain-containing protein [Phenylobacterium sp.]MBA4794211.1 STAS domain-containing protein [Phenylobacterium sp.]MBC7167194.1 STAS domain-containing protein [Phenylobacterium sp.]OHB36987.1 MAG: chemotaxis protein CheX [Phenylobacterium sp. RIFCSPHIGHO2_01_FULL_70_10]